MTRLQIHRKIETQIDTKVTKDSDTLRDGGAPMQDRGGLSLLKNFVSSPITWSTLKMSNHLILWAAFQPSLTCDVAWYLRWLNYPIYFHLDHLGAKVKVALQFVQISLPLQRWSLHPFPLPLALTVALVMSVAPIAVRAMFAPTPGPDPQQNGMVCRPRWCRKEKQTIRRENFQKLWNLWALQKVVSSQTHTIICQYHKYHT